MQVGASYRAEIGDHVIAAVDIGKCLIKRYVEHCKFVVAADKTLEESLIAESKSCEVIVRAIHKLELRAIGDIESSQIIVRADDIEKSIAVTHAERLHIIVRANKCGERRKTRNDQIGDLVVVDIEVLKTFDTDKVESGKLVISAI